MSEMPRQTHVTAPLSDSEANGGGRVHRDARRPAERQQWNYGEGIL